MSHAIALPPLLLYAMLCYAMPCPQNGYKRTAACKGHSSAIVSLTFSDDGVLLQSSDCVRETLFWDTATGKMMSDVARAQASKWDSWSNLLGPSMQV